MRDVHAKKVSEVRSDAGTHEKAIVFRDSRFRGVPAGQSVNFPSHGPVSVSSGTGIREAKKKSISLLSFLPHYAISAHGPLLTPRYFEAASIECGPNLRQALKTVGNLRAIGNTASQIDTGRVPQNNRCSATFEVLDLCPLRLFGRHQLVPKHQPGAWGHHVI